VLARRRGIAALFEIDDVRWTLAVRAHTQVRQYCGSALLRMRKELL
jgi:hypothetical protein